MGAINSACEGCFGKEIQPQESKKPAGSHDEKNKLLKNKPEQIPEGSTKLSHDASKDQSVQDSTVNKNKKINLSHFDRKRVIFLLENLSNGIFIRYWEEDHSVKYIWYKRRAMESSTP